MKSTLFFSSVLLVASAVPALLAGCASRQQARSHVPEAEFARYAQKYPQMDKYAKQGLSKDALYSLRYYAPQQEIMKQFTDAVEAKRIEVSTMHISDAKKHRLVLQYLNDIQPRYVNAANAAGIQAQQEEKKLGHSPFAQ